jgi:DNA-binding phage protein
MCSDGQSFELADLDGLELEEFDPAQRLTSREAIIAYMTDILRSGDVALFQSAVNDVLRAAEFKKVPSDREG